MIDKDHIIKMVANNCEVTLFFNKEENPKVLDNTLDILLSSFEKRMEKSIQSASNY